MVPRGARNILLITLDTAILQFSGPKQRMAVATQETNSISNGSYYARSNKEERKSGLSIVVVWQAFGINGLPK